VGKLRLHRTDAGRGGWYVASCDLALNWMFWRNAWAVQGSSWEAEQWLIRHDLEATAFRTRQEAERVVAALLDQDPLPPRSPLPVRRVADGRYELLGGPHPATYTAVRSAGGADRRWDIHNPAGELVAHADTLRLAAQAALHDSMAPYQA